LGTGINTRSTSAKAEVDNFYKTAIENQGKTNPHNPTLRTSTPIVSFKSIDFSLNDSVIVKDQSEIFVDTPEPVSDDSEDVTIQPVCETKFIPTKINKITMANQNPFATLKWRPFPSLTIKISRYHILLRDVKKQNLCCPSKLNLSFIKNIKIIRTRIGSEARRTIQDQIFDSVAQLTKYLNKFMALLKTFTNYKTNWVAFIKKTKKMWLLMQIE